ncbi:MAG: NAD-dependent epimerase/dehydratase family protein [Kiritimatiellae bacterium]|nr:NAD-dependent epimerase/dehydratase family protein [Kiritimatiellia bacterium]
MPAGKILIIGGSGFVSGTLARTARDQGYAVWVLTRGQKPLPEGVVPLRADRKDPAAFKAAVIGANVHWDLVVDCIGYKVEDARQDLEVFPALTSHLVFISTDFVFDPARRSFPQPFDNPATLTDDTYGGKKRHCELELLQADVGDMQWTVFRPCHIYGPGSELGCLPDALRVSGLLRKIKAGEPLRLVGGGHFLQQPIFAPDLAALILSVRENAMANRKIYCSVGPDIVESATYYRMIADELGAGLQVEELPIIQALKAHPEWKFYLCHRIYDLTPLRLDGLKVPNTPLREGLRQHVRWLEAR